MLFTPEQIEEILNVIEFHHLFVISTNFGPQVLTEEDKRLLISFGVDIEVLSKAIPLYDQMYYFGKLTAILRDKQAETIDFVNFFKYIKTGQYIPLSQREKFELDIAKRKSYTYLKGLKDKVKSSVETSILEQEQLVYQQTVKEGMVSGVQNRKSVSSIVSDLGHKLNDFKHDWGRIVETEMNNIFLQGRAMEIAEKYGDEVMVYKSVYPLACRHCIEKYLTNGVGSKPRLFKLKDLISNGNNIGKKVKQWVASLQSLHPFCRCLLKVVPPGYKWNEENQRFELPKVFEHKVERKSKIKIQVGDLKFEV